jgi:hypothetical protein
MSELDGSEVGSQPRANRAFEAMKPPRKTIQLDATQFVNGIYTPPGPCCAAEQSPSGTDDLLLMVHPIDNAVNSNYAMPLKANGRNTCQFNKVLATGSTVTFGTITLFQQY